MNPVGKPRGGWHPEGMAGEGVGGSEPLWWGVRRGRRLWRREVQKGKGRAGSGSVRSSGGMEYGWTGMGVWGCWSVSEEG